MIQIREKAVTDKHRVAEIIDLATADLRRVYRRATNTGTPGVNAEITPITLVAVEASLIVGVVDYCIEPDSLYIRCLAIHPQYRRRGIARALIQAIEEIANREGKLKLTLSTIKETGNPQIFTRLGFTVFKDILTETFEGVNGQAVTKTDMHRKLP